jgi:hypothetical protein
MLIYLFRKLPKLGDKNSISCLRSELILKFVKDFNKKDNTKTLILELFLPERSPGRAIAKPSQKKQTFLVWRA